MAFIKQFIHLLFLFTILPSIVGIVIGVHKARLRPALLLSVFLSWIGVIIAAFLRDDSPMGKRRRINRRLNQAPAANRGISRAGRLPHGTGLDY